MRSTETALKYKELSMVEGIFRTLKSVLETRPVYHNCDEAIRTHGDAGQALQAAGIALGFWVRFCS